MAVCNLDKKNDSNGHRPTIWNYLWALPCSILGLTIALIFVPFGICTRTQSGVLEVFPRREPIPWRLPFLAITFGHVVLGKNAGCLKTLRRHEMVHVRQYELWGVFSCWHIPWQVCLHFFVVRILIGSIGSKLRRVGLVVKQTR